MVLSRIASMAHVGAWFLLLGMLLPAAAVAAQPELVIEAPLLRDDHLVRHWDAMQEARPGSPEERAAFDALVRTAADVGVQELPVHALVLLAQARAALRNGDPHRAEVLLGRAALLAPALIAPDFMRAEVLLERSRANVVAALMAVGRAWGRMLESPVAGPAARAFVLDVAARTLMLFALAAALALWWRRRRLLVADLRAVSRFVMTKSMGAHAVLLALVMPALFFWSPALLVLTALGLVCLSLSLRERVVGLAILAALLALPEVVEERARQAASVPTSVVTLVQPITSPCDSACRQVLQQAMEGPRAQEAALALAWVHWRAGRGEDHAAAAALIEDLHLEGAASGSLALLRGNLAFAAGDAEGAEEAWEQVRAEATDPRTQLAAEVNLYRLMSDTGRRNQARMHVEQAIALDRAVADRYLNQSGRSQNLILSTMPTLQPELLAREVSAPWTEMAAQERLRPWLGLLTLEGMARGVWIVLGLLVAGGLIAPLRVTARACKRCGTPTGRFLHSEAFRAHLCVGCYQLDRFGGQLSMEQQKVREAPILWARNVRPRLEVVGAVLLPGASLIIGGRSLSGLILMVPAALGVALLMADRMSLRTPWVTETIGFLDGVPLFAVLLLLLSVLGSVMAMVLTEWWKE